MVLFPCVILGAVDAAQEMNPGSEEHSTARKIVRTISSLSFGEKSGSRQKLALDGYTLHSSLGCIHVEDSNFEPIVEDAGLSLLELCDLES